MPGQGEWIELWESQDGAELYLRDFARHREVAFRVSDITEAEGAEHASASCQSQFLTDATDLAAAELPEKSRLRSCEQVEALELQNVHKIADLRVVGSHVYRVEMWISGPMSPTSRVYLGQLALLTTAEEADGE